MKYYSVPKCKPFVRERFSLTLKTIPNLVHLSTVILFTLPAKCLFIYICSLPKAYTEMQNIQSNSDITIYLKDGILASIHIDRLFRITIINSKVLFTNLIFDHPSVIFLTSEVIQNRIINCKEISVHFSRITILPYPLNDANSTKQHIEVTIT
jgi:hypothetical protein